MGQKMNAHDTTFFKKWTDVRVWTWSHILTTKVQYFIAWAIRVKYIRMNLQSIKFSSSPHLGRRPICTSVKQSGAINLPESGSCNLTEFWTIYLDRHFFWSIHLDRQGKIWRYITCQTILKSHIKWQTHVSDYWSWQTNDKCHSTWQTTDK